MAPTWVGGSSSGLPGPVAQVLHDDGCECYRAVVVEARWIGMFREWYDGCGFKACCHSCLGKG